MARIPRSMITGEPTAYHIMSRTTLEDYPMDDVDKDFFVETGGETQQALFCLVL